VRHKGFAEYEGCHFRVWLIVQYRIKRVLRRFFAAVSRIFENMQRKACHRFGKDAHARVNGGGLHGGAFVNHLSAGGAAEKVSVLITGDSVLRRGAFPE